MCAMAQARTRISHRAEARHAALARQPSLRARPLLIDTHRAHRFVACHLTQTCHLSVARCYAGLPLKQVVTSTALTSCVASLGVGLFANLPVGIAPGMGLNAFLVYSQARTSSQRDTSDSARSRQTSTGPLQPARQRSK